ncbi:ITGB1 (predicted) [Pycnogonum litorale]
MDSSFALLIIFATSLICTISCQGVKRGLCSDQKTCSACTTADSRCGWCSKPNFLQFHSTRCDELTAFKGKRQCPDQYMTYPKNKQLNVAEKKLSKKGAKSENIVQIWPQEVRLTLRPKMPYPLVIKFKQAEDYPVDLYYLMDLSNSMADDKNKLAELGDLLADHMGNITSNFRLGFGSFVDKVVMPYTNTVPAKLISPCPGCAAPYGFKNHMSLSLNTDGFSTEVKKAEVSGNLDGPEGGFDAIMQAMACDNEIGWRLKSRKLLVFSTDSSFHSAGDGKIGGIVQPNDGACHLDLNGYYEESDKQDYPSLSQINQKAQEKKVNIIFAVTASQVPTYRNVGNHVEGASSGMLSNDSANVVELIKDQYSKITSHVIMKDTAPDYVKISYFSKCLGDLKEATNICKGLKVGTEVEFEAQIEVLECPADREKWTTKFIIYPVGLEPLTVNLNIICECNCESAENEEKNSPLCNNGTYQCGVCECYGDRYGRYCECDKSNPKAKNDTHCRYKSDQYVCSGRGRCTCGECECDKKSTPGHEITGNWCECDNFSCDRHQGKICSGPNNGECVCGQCKCRNGRSGQACQCASDKQCIYSDTQEMCSGNGICSCGTCICEEVKDFGKYYGTYCENHPVLKSNCDDFKDCVQCKVHGTGELSDDDNCYNCTQRMHIEKKEVVKVENSKTEVLCLRTDDSDCNFRYVYFFNDTLPVIYAKETTECPGAVDILAIVLGVIAGIVLIGLVLLLIWKLLTTIHDRREFAKFEKEAQSAKWDTGVNPLFKGATSTFKNPTYGGKQ